MPEELPLFVRISATDWVEGGWDVEQSVVLARHLQELGVDLIDVSSGALVPKARIPVGKGYQVPFARRIRDEAGILTGAVGLITEPQHANEIITGGDADLVFLARELLREPYWALKAQHELGAGARLADPVRLRRQAAVEVTRGRGVRSARGGMARRTDHTMSPVIVESMPGTPWDETEPFLSPRTTRILDEVEAVRCPMKEV